MLRYRPGETWIHRLDPRTKIALQIAFAGAAFAHTTPLGLLALTVVAGAAVLAAKSPIWPTVYGYRHALFLLALAPIVEGVSILEAGIALERGIDTALASYRVALILLVGAVYVHTTPLRESRAAVQWLVPGRPGQVLGLGVTFVGRLLPVLVADIGRHREAIRARAGDGRPRRHRMALLALGGVNRALRRADRFADALRARCFAWNPTLPPLGFGRQDLLGAVLCCGLLVGAALGLR